MDRPLSVLMVHPHDLWHDPWTIRPLELARRLRDRGHRVSLCHLPRRDAPDHAPLRQPAEGDPPVFEMKPRQQHFVHNIRLLRRLAAECDVIHLQKCFAAAALPALWVSRALGKPLHYDWDDNESALADIVEKRALSRAQIKAYEKRLPRFADTLTYSSEAIREAAGRLGFPAERMRKLPVGADLERFKPADGADRGVLREFGLDPNAFTALYIGQMEGAAHAHLLIEAAPMVRGQCPGAQFLLAGGGEQLESVRDLAERSPAAKAIALPGYLPQDRVPAVIAACDVCVACFEDNAASRAKSPLKIAEYLASGKPVVASDVGEAGWMIGDGGIAAAPGSAASLAEGIVEYARNPSRLAPDGRRARERALNLFNWERGAQTLEELYALALSL